MKGRSYIHKHIELLLNEPRCTATPVIIHHQASLWLAMPAMCLRILKYVMRYVFQITHFVIHVMGYLNYMIRYVIHVARSSIMKLVS